MTFGFSRDYIGGFLPEYLDQKILPVDPFQVLDRDSVGVLVKTGIDKGRATRPGLKIGICGEHGGDPRRRLDHGEVRESARYVFLIDALSESPPARRSLGRMASGFGGPFVSSEVAPVSSAARAEARDARVLRRSWAQMIKRIYEVVPLVCPSCGSEMKVIALISEHDVVDAILRHLERKESQEARAPPS